MILNFILVTLIAFIISISAYQFATYVWYNFSVFFIIFCACFFLVLIGGWAITKAIRKWIKNIS